MDGHPEYHSEPFHNATDILNRHSKVCANNIIRI